MTIAPIFQAHQHDIIHRDIKRNNMLLESGTLRVRLTDFGIAQNTTGQLAEVTQVGSSGVGTPGFMSPEQNLRQTLDARTDIYSLGMTLYYLLTGALAYDATNTAALALAFKEQQPKPPSQYNPEVPEELDRIVLKMIAVERDARYQSCDEVAAALKAIQDSLPGAGGAPVTLRTAGSLPAGGVTPAAEGRIGRVPRRWAIIVACLTVLAGGAFFVLRSVDWSPAGSGGRASKAPVVLQGDRLLAAGDIGAARQEYQRVFDAPESSPEEKAAAAAGLGRITSVEGDQGAAMKWYERALASDPDNARALGGYAVLLAADGEFDTALAGIRSHLGDPWLRRLAGQIERSAAIRDRLAQSDHIRKLVDDLVVQYGKQTASGGAKVTDEWTSRLVVVCFRMMESRGAPSFHEGEDSVLIHDLTARMLDAGQYGVVDREELDQVLTELKLATSALADPEAALRFGRVRSARVFVFVTTDRRDNTVRVSVKMVDSETTDILGLGLAESEGQIDAATVDLLLKDLVSALRKAFPVRGRIAGVAEGTVELTIG